MTNLSVNINKIALVRNSRKGNTPCIENFSRICIENGAKGITVHPRPDLRHIKPDDLELVSSITKELSVEFNIEGNPFLIMTLIKLKQHKILALIELKFILGLMLKHLKKMI